MEEPTEERLADRAANIILGLGVALGRDSSEARLATTRSIISALAAGVREEGEVSKVGKITSSIVTVCNELLKALNKESDNESK